MSVWKELTSSITFHAISRRNMLMARLKLASRRITIKDEDNKELTPSEAWWQLKCVSACDTGWEAVLCCELLPSYYFDVIAST